MRSRRSTNTDTASQTGPVAPSGVPLWTSRLLAPLSPAGERLAGEGPFAYVSLTRLWHRIRYFGCITAVAIGVALVSGGLVSQGIAVGIGGVLALLDTRYRLTTVTATLWPSFLIDAILIAVAAPIAGIPTTSLLAAFAYLGTAALFFLKTGRAVVLLAAMAAIFTSSARVAEVTGLDQAQTTNVGSATGAIAWTGFLFGLVWVATRAVNTFHLERETSRIRLQELLSAKDTFVATVSHELRTPMTAVVGLAQHLRDDGETLAADERGELVGLIAAEAVEAAYIIEDLLVAARIDDGKVSVQPSTVDLALEVATVVRSLGTEISISNESVADATAFADPLRVRQIVRNLVTNAVRHGAPPVAVCAEPGRVIVTDHGAGIPVADRERVFEPYGRSGTDHAAGSIGLGLAVSRSIADLMGGELSYRRVGAVSIFELKLPRDPG